MENSILIEKKSIIIDINTNDTLYDDTNILFRNQDYIVEDGTKTTINVTNAYMYFTKVNIICPIKSTEHYYIDSHLSNERNNIIKNNMIVHTINGISILTNKFFASNIKILTKKQISEFNNVGQSFNDNNLTVYILSINYFDLKNFLNLFEQKKTMKDLHKIVIMNEYFKLDKNHYKLNTELVNLLSNLDGSNFWTLPYNTSYNYDYIFNNRKIEQFNKKSTNISDYGNIIVPLNKKITIANLEKKGKRLFRNVKPSEFPYEDMNALFEYFMQTDNNCQKLTRLNYQLVENLLVNPKLTHLVINNPFILDKLDLTTHKFKKLISYSWVHLYRTELLLDNTVKESDNIVFDIDTASKLPNYSINYNFKSNPYFPLLVSDRSINVRKNVLGIPTTNETNIATMGQFQRQMNIFTSGKPYINIFENIDLVSKNIVICGSIIPACAIMNHPNLQFFDNDVLPFNEDEERKDAILRRFFAEYYAKSDIDIQINNPNHYEFCKIANDLFNELLLNFCRFFRDAEPDLFRLKETKSIGLFITHKYLEDIGFDKNKIDQLKFFIKQQDNENIFNMLKLELSTIYNSIIEEECSKLSELDKKYCDNFLPSFKLKFEELKDNNINVCFNTKIVDNVFTGGEIKMYVNTKYIVSSPFLNHDLEIFRNKSSNPFELVSKFHLNCVRGYYTGKTVKLLPSCITALKTFVNIDFKYFAGKRSPYQIINKYRMRGMSTLLNKKEIKDYDQFTKNDPFWSKLVTINECKNKNCKTCSGYGFLTSTSNIFKPRKFCPESFFLDKIQIIDLVYNNIPKYVVDENISPYLSIDKNGQVINL
tara:strand:- start:70 stop:2535 length:2466 start_codon:yes stop_codon:yes gene_type:complete